MNQFVYNLVILSAGESSRMGYFPKALLDSGDGTPFLRKIISNAKNIIPEPERVIVVLGYHREKIEDAVDLSDCLTVINPDPSRGMLSSVLTALEKIAPSSSGLLLSLVDHPLVKIDTYRKIIDEAARKQGKIIIPVCDGNGRRGHPVFFPREIFNDLKMSPLNEGARWAVRKNSGNITNLAVDDEGIYLDIDTKDQYRAVSKSFRDVV